MNARCSQGFLLPRFIVIGAASRILFPSWEALARRSPSSTSSTPKLIPNGESKLRFDSRRLRLFLKCVSRLAVYYFIYLYFLVISFFCSTHSYCYYYLYFILTFSIFTWIVIQLPIHLYYFTPVMTQRRYTCVYLRLSL